MSNSLGINLRGSSSSLASLDRSDPRQRPAPKVLPEGFIQKTCLIVGASRGIGLEFVKQLLAQGHIVLATARSPFSKSSYSAQHLWALIDGDNGHNLKILEVDVGKEKSIMEFKEHVRELSRDGEVLEEGIIDVVILNAGILEYPGRISEISFSKFEHHMNTNCIGPLTTAQALLSLSTYPPKYLPSQDQNQSSNLLSLPTSPKSPGKILKPIHIRTLVFISSDSGSASQFRSFEDGFGAYACSKAALNQGLRHLSAELYRDYQRRQEEFNQGVGRDGLHREGEDTAMRYPSTPSSPSFPSTLSPNQPSSLHPTSFTPVPVSTTSPPHPPPTVLAIHPGEVSTDMATSVDLAWEVQGIISAEESIRGMLKVIAEKGFGGSDEGGRMSRRRNEPGDAGKREDGEATFWTWEGMEYSW